MASSTSPSKLCVTTRSSSISVRTIVTHLLRLPSLSEAADQVSYRHIVHGPTDRQMNSFVLTCWTDLFRNARDNDLWYSRKHPPGLTPTSENSIFPIAGRTDPAASPVCGGDWTGLYIVPIRTIIWCTRKVKDMSPRLDDALVDFDILENVGFSNVGTNIDEPGMYSLSQVWLHELMHAFLGCECLFEHLFHERGVALPRRVDGLPG